MYNKLYSDICLTKLVGLAGNYTRWMKDIKENVNNRDTPYSVWKCNRVKMSVPPDLIDEEIQLFNKECHNS